MKISCVFWLVCLDFRRRRWVTTKSTVIIITQNWSESYPFPQWSNQSSPSSCYPSIHQPSEKPKNRKPNTFTNNKTSQSKTTYITYWFIKPVSPKYENADLTTFPLTFNSQPTVTEIPIQLMLTTHQTRNFAMIHFEVNRKKTSREEKKL